MTLLKDDRFSAMFSNPDFQIDTESPEFKLLNPVVSKLDKAKKKQQQMSQFKEILNEGEEVLKRVYLFIHLKYGI